MHSQAFMTLNVLVISVLYLAVNFNQINAQQQQFSCYKQAQSAGIDFHNCDKALSRISYDSSGSLDASSTSAFVWHKSCVINIEKKRQVQPSRQQVEYGVRSLLQTCPTKGGIYHPSNDFKIHVYSSNRNNVYNLNAPVCLKHRCHVNPTDCLNAFNHVPLNSKGYLTSNTPYQNLIKTSSGNCTVTLKTTDGSGFRTNHPELNSGVKALLSQCGNRVGYTYFGGGTLGSNGNIKIITQNTNQDGNCY